MVRNIPSDNLPPYINNQIDEATHAKAGYIRNRGGNDGGGGGSSDLATGTWTCGNPDCEKKIRRDVQERCIAKRIRKGDKDTEPPVPNAFLCFDCHSKHAKGTDIKISDGSVKRRPAYQQKGNSNGTSSRANHVDVSELDKTSKGRLFWNVLYSDGKAGDLWDTEMIKYCIDCVDGKTPGLKTIKTDHPLSVSAAAGTINSDDDVRPESYGNSESQGGESFVLVDDINYLIDNEICKQRLIDHDYYYTVSGDSFKDVCRATNLNKAQWPMYYAWVNEFFMRGEFFLQRNDDDSYTYPDGIGFPNPFKKGVSRPCCAASTEMSHAAAAVEYELVFGQRRHAHYEIAANRLIGDQDIKLQPKVKKMKSRYRTSYTYYYY